MEGSSRAGMRAVICAYGSLLVIGLHGQAGALDPTFNPGDIGNGNGDGFHPYDAYAVGVRADDGRLLIGGEFQTYNGSGPAYLVALEANGARDASFQLGAGPDGVVNSVIALDDGRWMVSGGFQHYDGSAANGVVRLLANGVVDPTFSASLPPGAFVTKAAVQPDGRTVLAGIRYINPDTFVCWMGRLNTDGSLDNGFAVAAFDTTDGNILRDLALAADGDILVGGRFNRCGGVARSNVLRLNNDGGLDPGFDPGAGFDSDVWALAVRPDGRVLAAGFFTQVQGAAHRGLVQLMPDGDVDGGFDIGEGFNLATLPFVDAQVFSLRLMPDGQVYVGGWYDELDGQPQRGLVRLNSDGSVVPTFDVGAGCPRYIYAITPLSEDRVLIAGTFESYDGRGTGNIARLLPDGSFDSSFNSCTGFSIFTTGQVNGWSQFGTGPTAFSPLPDGGLVAVGLFGAYNGAPRARMVRLSADGGLDAGFDPGAGPSNDDSETSVNVAVALADGRVVVGGAFTKFGGAACGNIARLLANGSVDPDFDAGSGFNGAVVHVVRRPDGRMLVSGPFSTCNGTTRAGLAQLLPDGALDGSFVPPAVQWGPLALQPDGRVIVGGAVRLEATGALDPSWSVGDGFGGGQVNCALLQADGSLIVGGGFTEVDGAAHAGIVRLDASGSVDPTFDPGDGFMLPGLSGEVFALALQADGRVLVGGRFTECDGVPRSGIARLLPDGTVDLSFDPGTGFSGLDPGGDSFTGVLALCLQPDERLLAGGFFTQYDGVGRNRIVRIITAGDACIPTQLTAAADPVVSCGAVNLTFDGTSTIAATEVPGADRYQFRFTNIPGQPAYARNIAFPARSFTLTKWSTNPLKAGRTYSVVVRASFDNGATWCDWGPSCTVKVSWAPLPPEQMARMALDADVPVLQAFPVPASTYLRVLAPGAGPALVELISQDGRLARRATMGGDPLMELDVHDLPGGLYMLRWSGADGGTEVVRVVLE